MNTISFESTEAADYLSQFLSRILPSDCICVSLLLERDTDLLYLVRLEKSVEPMLIKLKFQRRFLDEFRSIMSENDASMKQSDRRKFWNVRNALNKKLVTYLSELETTVFGRCRALLLGSYVAVGGGAGLSLSSDEGISSEFKRRFSSSAVQLTSERLMCLKLIVLALDQYTLEQIRDELKTCFESACVGDVENWLIEVVKPKVAGLKRKHVCLIVDRVCCAFETKIVLCGFSISSFLYQVSAPNSMGMHEHDNKPNHKSHAVHSLPALAYPDQLDGD